MKTNILKIYSDKHPESPREWSNLGTMACWHNRYNLGDERPDCSPQEHKVRLIEEYADDFGDDLEKYTDFLCEYRGWTPNECDEHADEIINEVFNEHYISLPLYLYDHGNITMSTGSFSCPWDSGQVGFIYVPRTVAEDEYKLFTFPHDSPDKIHTLEERICYILKGEIETYDQYLRGDIYGFVLESPDEEQLDSCWGFYGSDWRTNGIADHVDVNTVAKVQYMQSSTRSVYEVFEEEEL